jgi:exosortase K
MLFVKRNDIFLYAGSIVLCAITYTVLNKNTELALLPHKTVLEYLFNFNFVYIENVGYEQTNGLFTISQNCLGGKLFISLFSIMIFGFLHKYTELKYKIAAVIKFYFTAVILAFVITIIRISASVPFCTWERVYLIHTVISLGIYFAAGLTLYFAMERRVKA